MVSEQIVSKHLNTVIKLSWTRYSSVIKYETKIMSELRIVGGVGQSLILQGVVRLKVSCDCVISCDVIVVGVGVAEEA